MILAIVQARMSSSRLPGKVLKPLLGKPMLHRQLERIDHAKTIDKTIVATSVEPSDDGVFDYCRAHEKNCFRGELNNVLGRFYHCAAPYTPEHVIRLTADCPLIDPELIDEVVKLHIEGEFDYTTNAIPRSYPDGLDVEVMRFDALKNAYQNAKTAIQTEHVTVYIREHPEQFKLGYLKCPEDLSNQRWTVDYPEDFEVVEQIYQKLYPNNPAFDYHQVMALFEAEPELFALNQHHI